MERRSLSKREIDELKNMLPEWEIRDGKLHKLFQFSSFADAIGWMVKISIYADKIDHHPDWSNVYNKVEVQLITHDLGVLSTLDVALAKHMDT